MNRTFYVGSLGLSVHLSIRDKGSRTRNEN